MPPEETPPPLNTAAHPATIEQNAAVEQTRAQLRVVTTTERTFVVRNHNGRAEWADVSKGLSDGDLIEVLGNLQVGDRVVRRATDELRQGALL